MQTQASWPAGWKMDVTQFARMVAELLTLMGDLLFLGELIMASKSTAPIRGNQVCCSNIVVSDY